MAGRQFVLGMDTIKLSIIIINWNGKKWLKECFNSIYKQTFKNWEVIFVDNASADGSVDFVRDNYPETTIVENKENLGFGRANNIGAEKARGEILFLLNNDTVIEDPDFLEKLLDYKERNELDITGPMILNFAEADIYKGRKISIDCTGYLGWAKETFYVEGCAMLVSRDLFLKLGGFDEKYFMYSEDIDLCWRAHLLGEKVEICQEVQIVHFGGGTSETTQLDGKEKHLVPIFRKYEVEKNNLRNLLKNYSFANLLWTVPLFLLQLLLESAVYFLSGNWKIIRHIAMAVGWNIKNLKDTLGEREKIQGQRIVRDQKILKKMSRGINKPGAFLAIGLPKFK